MNLSTLKQSTLDSWVGSKRARLVEVEEWNGDYGGEVTMSNVLYTSTNTLNVLAHPHKKPATQADYWSRTLWFGDLPTSQNPISFELGQLYKGSDTIPTSYKLNGQLINAYGVTQIIFKPEPLKIALIDEIFTLIIETDHNSNQPAVIDWEHPSDSGGWRWMQTTGFTKSVYALKFSPWFEGSPNYNLEMYIGYKKDGNNVVFASSGIDASLNGGVYTVGLRGTPITTTATYVSDQFTRMDLYDRMSYAETIDPDDNQNTLSTQVVHTSFRNPYLDSDWFKWSGFNAHEKIDEQGKYWTETNNATYITTLTNTGIRNYATWVPQNFTRKFVLPSSNVAFNNSVFTFSEVKIGHTSSNGFIVAFTTTNTSMTMATKIASINTVIKLDKTGQSQTGVITGCTFPGEGVTGNITSIGKADTSTYSVNGKNAGTGLKYQNCIHENLKVEISYIYDAGVSGQVECYTLTFNAKYSAAIFSGLISYKLISCATISNLMLSDGINEPIFISNEPL